MTNTERWPAHFITLSVKAPNNPVCSGYSVEAIKPFKGLSKTSEAR